jgi:predicted porin
LALSGGFGTVRIGRFVPATTMGYQGFSGAATVSQAGSIYAIGTGGSGAANFGAATTTLNLERNDNLIQYTTPNFNGFTANVLYSNNSSDSNATAATGKNRGTANGLSLAYAAGPLSIAAGTNTIKVDTEAGTVNACISAAGVISISTSTCTGGTVDTGIAIADSKSKTDQDWIGGSYDLGVATVMATQVKRKDSTAGATASDISATSFGVSVPMGAFTFNASTYTGKNKLTSLGTDDLKLSGHQLSVRYALSKRTTVYAAMGENKTKRDGGNTAGATRKFTSNAVGLMHSF